MGKLRIEPKVKTMDPDRYRDVKEILVSAMKVAGESHIYYDLDGSENAANTRKDFAFVAESENINLRVRRVRGSQTLKLLFSSEASAKSSRLDPEESRRRILDVLKHAGEPMKKAQILKQSGINRGAWNVRIRELIESGDVIREGERRDTVYFLKGKKAGGKHKK